MKATTMKPGRARVRDGAAAACSLALAPEFRNYHVGEATSTLGPLPCRAAVMRSVIIGDSFLRADRRRCPFASPPRTKECSPATKPERTAHRRRPRQPAGARVVANLARARRRSRRETHPGGRHTPKGACLPQAGSAAAPLRDNGPIRASRQRPGRPSQRRLGGDCRPRRIVRHSPRGGPSWRSAAQAQAAVDAPLRKNHVPSSGLTYQVFWESMPVFIDQAAPNGTRPNSPVGVKPAMTPGHGAHLPVALPPNLATPLSLKVTVTWQACEPQAYSCMSRGRGLRDST
jgi:hypothetical protein